jgi:hypothetical protein
MQMKEQTKDILSKVHFPAQFDRNEQDELLSQLRQDILELDVDAVRAVTQETIPNGAMAITTVFSDAFVVSFSANLAASLIAPIIFSMWSWIKRQKSKYRNNEIRIEISKGTSKFVLTSTMSESDVSLIVRSLIPLFDSALQENSQTDQN